LLDIKADERSGNRPNDPNYYVSLWVRHCTARHLTLSDALNLLECREFPDDDNSVEEFGEVKYVLAIVLLFWAGSAGAQDKTINIELNNIAARNDVCQVYFRVRNQTDTAYSAFKLDLAFFDKSGVINDRALIDLAPLRGNKTSIHVFDMPDLDCATVGEVLLNDITECIVSGEGKASADCFASVSLSSRGKLSFVH
jgi:hypothetical protein